MVFVRIEVRTRKKGGVTGGQDMCEHTHRVQRGTAPKNQDLPAFSAACTCTWEHSKIEVFPNMSQRSAGAFHPGVLAGTAFLMEHALKRAGADILGYKLAKH